MGNSSNRSRSKKRTKAAKARRAVKNTGQSLPSSGNTRQDGKPWQPKKCRKVGSAHFVRGKKYEHPQNPALGPTIMPEKSRTTPRRQSARQQWSEKTDFGSVSSDLKKVNTGIHFERWTRERTRLQLSDVNFVGYLLDLLSKVKPKPKGVLSDNAVSMVKNCTAALKACSSKTPSRGLNLSNAHMKVGVAPQKSQRPGMKNDKVERLCIRTKTAQIRKPYAIQKTISTINKTKATPAAAFRAIRFPTTQENSAGKIFVVNNKTAVMPDIDSILKALQLPPNMTLKKLGEANLKSSSLDTVDASVLKRIVTPFGAEAEPSAVSVSIESPEIPTQQDDEMIVPEILPGSESQNEWVKKEHEETDESSQVDNKNVFSQIVPDVAVSFENEERVVKYIKTEPPNAARPLSAIRIHQGVSFLGAVRAHPSLEKRGSHCWIYPFKKTELR